MNKAPSKLLYIWCAACVTTIIAFSFACAAYYTQSSHAQNTAVSIYSSCGQPDEYYGHCTDESCLDSEAKQVVYSVWKEAFLERNALSDAEYSSHIELDDITLTQRDADIIVWVKYVFHTNWVRVPKSYYFTIKNTTLNEPLDVASVTEGMLSIESGRSYLYAKEPGSVLDDDYAPEEVTLSVDDVQNTLSTERPNSTGKVNMCNTHINPYGQIVLSLGGIFSDTEKPHHCYTYEFNLSTGKSVKNLQACPIYN